ncbi:hypothetical protein PG994_000130 [Apiospora phragmitis]|uniref:Uncharacterized protein n=1 Tax=Apiospora phragmitis TaxID=2905665 RepID=A0ABR1X5F3_9PEZI
MAWNATTSPPGAITSTVYAILAPTSVPTSTTNPDPPTHTPDTDSAMPTKTPDTTSDQGLSRSDKIALGCGIGLGLPGTIAAIFSCIIAMRRW